MYIHPRICAVPGRVHILQLSFLALRSAVRSRVFVCALADRSRLAGLPGVRAESGHKSARTPREPVQPARTPGQNPARARVIVPPIFRAESARSFAFCAESARSSREFARGPTDIYSGCVILLLATSKPRLAKQATQTVTQPTCSLVLCIYISASIIRPARS
jgi:hypothetical protein